MSRDVVFHEEVLTYHKELVSFVPIVPLPHFQTVPASDDYSTIDHSLHQDASSSVSPVDLVDQSIDSSQAKSLPKRSTRVKKPPSHLEVYKTNLPQPRNNCCTRYPIQDYLSTSQLDPVYHSVIASISALFEPETYEQAIAYKCQNTIMKEELHSLENNGTWIVVTVPIDQHVVGCKWVFKLNLNADGSVERYKARLVAKGYSQIGGFDFSETFSPVAKHTTVRTFLALAATFAWSLCQLGISNAFLNGDLDEYVYMEMPLGCSPQRECKPRERLVCKLQKSLYGLKQASR